MKTLTEQQIFTKSATHLLKQKKKAGTKTEHGFSCKNYTKDGFRCAVGCLIPIKHYKANETIWAGGFSDPLCWDHFKAFGLTDNHRVLLSELMAIHDVEKPSRWAQKLRVLAKNRGLKMPVVKGVS